MKYREKGFKIQARKDLKYHGERILSTRERGVKVQGRKNLKYKGERIKSTREKVSKVPVDRLNVKD